MQPQDDVVMVDPDEKTVGCDGGDGPLGHPLVYYSFGLRSEVVCGYCGRRFIRQGVASAKAS